MSRHHLRDAKPADLVTICRDICGVQAQVMSAGRLQLWVRNHRVTASAIDAALWQKKSLVKTSLMRQTVHLVPSDEFSLYIAALKKSRLDAVLRIMAKCGISLRESDKLTADILEAIDAGCVTRSALRAAMLARAGKKMRKWMELVWSIVRVPVSEGLICYGPDQGNEVTFIRTDQWVGKQKPVTELNAQCILFRKYLAAYGPATVRDFRHWSGISMKDCKAVHDCIRDDLMEVKVDGATCSVLRRDYKEFSESALSKGNIKLLPHFDPYLLAHAEKEHLLANIHYKRVYRNQGWISPVILIDGKVIGVWSYKMQGRTLLIQIEPFAKLSRAIRGAIEQEAAALGVFFDRPHTIEFGTP